MGVLRAAGGQSGRGKWEVVTPQDLRVDCQDPWSPPGLFFKKFVKWYHIQLNVGDINMNDGGHI